MYTPHIFDVKSFLLQFLSYLMDFLVTVDDPQATSFLFDMFLFCWNINLIFFSLHSFACMLNKHVFEFIYLFHSDLLFNKK